MRVFRFFLLLFSLLLPRELLAQDTTCGIIWDEPILLSDTTENAHSPKVMVTGDDTVYITWESHFRIFQLPFRRSTTGGATFEQTRELLTDSLSFPFAATWTQMVATRNRVFVFFRGASGSDSPVWMIESSDFGNTWSQVRSVSPDTAGEVRSAAISGEILLVIYNPLNDFKKILRSTDAGQTWTRTNENLDYWARVALTAGGVLHLVQHTADVPPEIEYRRSTDLGTSWNQISVLSEADQFWSDIPTIASGDDSLLLVAWRDAKYGCLSFGGCSIIAREGVAGLDSVAWVPEAVISDTPRGFKARLSINANRRAVSWVDEVVSNTTYHAALRLSAISSPQWCPVIDITSTTPHKVINVDVALSSKAVHVVWEQNVAPSPSTFRIFYRRGRFVTTDLQEEPPRVPREFLLAQNYPNPFNPITNINYRLPKAELVSLKVYDMLGREAAILVQGKKEPGEHTVVWDAERVPSGVYYYRLIAGERIETKKAVLIR